MTQVQLNILERDVEDARARFAGDLARLRAPSTLSDFKDELWAEASETKDTILEKTKQSATDGVQRLFADLKDRAAANPGAALAIGAGLAWRIIQRPPVATLLVGLGAFSLWRTSPSGANGAFTTRSAKIADAATEKARGWASGAEERLSQLSEQVSSTAERASVSAQETIQTLKAAATRATERATNAAQETASELGERAAVAKESASNAFRHLTPSDEARDNLLLGAAALAVAAALGIAYQRGIGDSPKT